MQRIWRVALVALMLCGLIAVFITAFVTAGTASAASSSSGPTCDKSGDCCSGEFCCWAQGQTPPSCSTASTTSAPQSAATAPAPEQTAPVKGKQVGKIEGERAGQDDPVGTNRPCPGLKGSEYCGAWEAAYAAAQAAKAQQQGSSGISLNGILKVVGIIVAVGIIVWMGAALAGIEIATTAVKVVARFFSGNKP